MIERDDDPELRARLRRLPREALPNRDLWPGVAGRIAPSRGVAVRRIFAAVAPGIVAAAAVAALVLRPHGARTTPMASASSVEAAAPHLDAAVFAGEPDYQRAELALATELASRRPAMAPGEAAVLDQSLLVVDDAIASTRQALVRDPDDADLRAELDRVWRDKLDLLEQATELPSEM
jgi:hypothetical protein